VGNVDLSLIARVSHVWATVMKGQLPLHWLRCMVVPTSRNQYILGEITGQPSDLEGAGKRWFVTHLKKQS